MAKGIIGTTNNQTVTTGAQFIPEIWSDETIAAYKSNLVIANLVTRLNHKGKKGDTIHIPTPVRGSATSKEANTKVTIQGDTHNTTNLSIDKHYEYSVLIEDIAEVQALSSLRKFYTDDAGYALAKQVDNDLATLFEVFSNNAAAPGVVGGTGAAMYEKAVIGSMIIVAARNIDPAAAIPPCINKGKAGIAPTGRYTYESATARKTIKCPFNDRKITVKNSENVLLTTGV